MKRHTSFHKLTQDVGPPAEGPVALEGVPEGERRGEVAEEEVGDGESQDERVPRVESELPGTKKRQTKIVYTTWTGKDLYRWSHGKSRSFL